MTPRKRGTAATLVAALMLVACWAGVAASAPQIKLMPLGLEGGAQLGLGVDLDGETAVLMTAKHPTSGASVFVYVNTVGSWIVQEEIEAPEIGPGPDGFGRPVALDGDTIVIAAPGLDAAAARRTR